MAKVKYRFIEDRPQVIYGVKTFMQSPLAPTPSAEDDSDKLANTAFVKDNIGGGPSFDFTDMALMFLRVNSTATAIEFVDLFIPDGLSDLIEDSDHQSVTALEKIYWNEKQPAGDYVTQQMVEGLI